MYPIFLPINPNSKGNEVTNLQECLLFLLDSKIFIAYQPPNRPGQEELNQWRKMLLEEKALSLFGEGTRQLVFNFQVQQGLGDNLRGVVEETTAVKMNELLKSLGAFREYIVYGTVVNSDSSPAQGLTVNAFDKTLQVKTCLANRLLMRMVPIGLPTARSNFGGPQVKGAGQTSLYASSLKTARTCSKATLSSTLHPNSAWT